MYPVLILREEAVCLIILGFLAALSKRYRLGKDSRTFTHLIAFAITHVIMDIITVWTVNHTEQVPHAVNYLMHVIFYMTAIFFSYEIFNYILKLIFGNGRLKWFVMTLIPPVLYLCMLPFLPIEFVDVTGTGTWSSTGPAAYVGYGVAFLYFLAGLLLIFANWKKLTQSVRYSLVPMMLLLIIVEAAQIVWRELLFTGGAITIVTVGFFFSTENPAAALEHKMMLDAMTGVYSRNTYEEDIKKYDAEFTQKPDTAYTFVFSDINNLKSINGLYGHSAGDECISYVAVAMLNGMRNAEKVYRMGGDEFLAIYRKVNEKTIQKDLQRVRQTCEEQSGDLPCKPVIAIGYAISSPEYKSLRDVLRIADYMMYRNKTEIKRDQAYSHISTGTKLNLTGLTDRIFDAMCASSENAYPFLLNMETGVMRVDPEWKEEFALESEFFTEFDKVWSKKIHPDDQQLFLEDLTATVTGKKQYHFCQYRALNRNNEYVSCTCRGSIYHGKDGQPDIFAGTLYNHGVRANRDQTTGLPNYETLDEIVEENIRNGKEFSVLKLSNGNMNRIRLIYGYDQSTMLIKNFCDTVSRIAGEYGRAFSNTGSEFALLFQNTDKEKIKAVFKNIRHECESGIRVEDHVIPIRAYGAAICMPECGFSNHHALRGALLYAMNTAYATDATDVVFFEPKENQNEDIKLMTAVYEDATNKQERFYLKYQPIIRVKDGALIGAEALIRWNDPEKGEIPPGRFISMLENDPCYDVLGIRILRWAIRDARQVLQFCPEFRISVNITATQLRNRHFADEVLKVLEEEQYPADHLVLELTERCKTMNFELLERRVKGLRAQGIRMALDDMGTGYSTIDLLLNLDVDEVKLDREFVMSLGTNERSVAYTKALCEGAESRETAVCFEGIETEEMTESIRAFGDVLAQGYYYDRPLILEKFMERYAGTRSVETEKQSDE